jgi:hypothetical protein
MTCSAATELCGRTPRGPRRDRMVIVSSFVYQDRSDLSRPSSDNWYIQMAFRQVNW